MITYQLVQSRRHVFQLRADSEVIAEIAMLDGRASVIVKDARFELRAVDGVRRRVVMINHRNHTLVRPSTLGQYAIDLDNSSLYWRSFPCRVYGWITADEKLAIRYSPVDDGSWAIDVLTDAPLPATIAGAFLILRSALELAPQFQPAVRRSTHA